MLSPAVNHWLGISWFSYSWHYSRFGDSIVGGSGFGDSYIGNSLLVASWLGDSVFGISHFGEP